MNKLGAFLKFSLIAIIIACTTTSCEKPGGGDEPTPQPVPVDPVEKGNGIKFSATIPVQTGIVWAKHHRININGVKSAGPDSSSIGKNTAGILVKVPEASYYGAIFPDTAAVYRMTESAGIDFPENQTYSPIGIDTVARILIGGTKNRTLEFKPSYSVFEVTVSDPLTDNALKLSSVMAESYGEQKMSGIMNTDFSSIYGGDNSAVAIYSPDGSLPFGKSIFLAVPAQSYESGFRIIALGDDGSRMVVSKPDAFEAEPGQTYKFDLGEYDPTELSISTANAVSTSSLTLAWESIKATAPTTKWKVSAYSDKDCTKLIRSADAGTGKNFTLGGFTPGSTVWVKVQDSGETMNSDPVGVSLENFSPVQLPSKIETTGVLLAEDFRAVTWGNDPYSGAPGSFEGEKHAFAEITGSSLVDWISQGQTGFHPGYVALSNSVGEAWVETPVFNLTDNNKALVSVDIKAAGVKEGKTLKVAVVAGSGSFVLPDRNNRAKYCEIQLDDNGKWNCYSIDALTVSNGDRIAFGGDSEVLLGQLSVSANDLSSIFVTTTTVTSSTLSFSWTESVSAQDDASHPYRIELFSDPNCTDCVQKYDFAVKTFSTANVPSFCFSSLKQGLDYYFRVTDTESGAMSSVVKATTDEFSIRQMPSEIKQTGLVFAEDFSELRWDCDNFGKCAGFIPQNTDNFANGFNSLIEYGGSSVYLLPDQTNALPGSRLNGWASESYVYVHPGMLELGKTADASGKDCKGWILTPEFPVANGGTITVDVTINASSYSNTDSKMWCIAVLNRSNANVTGYKASFDHHPDLAEYQKIQLFTLDSPGEWQTIKATGLVLEPGDRIMFGLKGSVNVPAGGDDARAFLKDIKVEATEIFLLDDLFTFSDGRKVSTVEDWAERRKDIQEIFQAEMYGRMPEDSPIYTERFEKGNTYIDGVPAIREQFHMWFKEDHSGPRIDWLVVRPRNAGGPVPTILTLNFDGNHTLMLDKEIVLPTCWLENDSFYGIVNNKATEAGRGVLAVEGYRYYYPMAYFINRGYAFVSACYGEVSSDPEDPSKQDKLAYGGVFELWGPRDPSVPDNTMALMAWAWAYRRGMDLIETRSELDETKVVITGCSRLGKATLIAGAFDERFAVVAPVQTGSGGAPLTKHITPEKESIADETTSYTHWFVPGYAKYAGKGSTMKFDQHMLISCVAPRPLLVMGFDKAWFDTYGEFLSAKAASPAWNFLGVSGIPDVDWPDDNSTAAIGKYLGYAHRAGEHGIVMTEWEWMLDFADANFR